MSNLGNRRSFSSPSLEALLPPPIPTGKGSRSAIDPEFSEYIDNRKQVPELILPEHVRHSEPADIDYQLLLQGDDDSVNRLFRSAADFGVFQIRGHGISTEELKSTLTQNQWIFKKLSQTSRHCVDHEEVVWCPEIAEKAQNILGKINHIFRSKMNEVACKLQEIAEELASNIARGAIRTGESMVVIHRHHQSNSTIDQLHCSSTNERGKVLSKYAFRLHLLLEPGKFFSQEGGVGFPFFTRPNTIVVTVEPDDFEKADEFENAVENLKFKTEEKEELAALFSMELKWSSSSDTSAFRHSNSAKKFSLADQILILLLLTLLYKTSCVFFS